MIVFIIALILILLISGMGEEGHEYDPESMEAQKVSVKISNDVPLNSQFLSKAFFQPDSTVRG